MKPHGSLFRLTAVLAVAALTGASGWAEVDNNNPSTINQNGTTTATGSAISHDIRNSVGSPNATDDNTSTGTSSKADPNNQPHSSIPVTSGVGGTAVQGTSGQAVNHETTQSSAATTQPSGR
jgi:hypothetical protein